MTDSSDNSASTVVVSLAYYTPDDESWNLAVDEEKQLIRAPGGATQLDIISKTRPLNLFVPQQTAGWLFTAAGVISNSVHGGNFGQAYVHGLVTKLRVMLHNGTITILATENELRYWRNSFGLLGIISGAEFKLERRENFRMATLPPMKLQSWDKGTFDTFVEGIRSEYSYAQFFFNPYNKEFLTVVHEILPPEMPSEEISDSDCVWNFGERNVSANRALQKQSLQLVHFNLDLVTLRFL